MARRIDLNEMVVGVRGGGDIASGVIYRLHRCGFKVFVTEIAEPLAVRRTVSFCEAAYDGRANVEDVEAVLVQRPDEAQAVWGERKVPLYIDPDFETGRRLEPDVVVDAILAKKNLGTDKSLGPLTIALGPGFEAGTDVHYVVETNRGHYLGRLIEKGAAQPNTGVPGPIEGVAADRVLRAPADGVWEVQSEIGRLVKVGDAIGQVAGKPVKASINGVLRGLIRPGIAVTLDMKIGDIDPRGLVGHCFSISEKALAISGGVLEGIMKSCAA